MLSICLDLKLDIWPIKDDVDLHQLKTSYWNRVPNKWLNPKIIEFLDSIQLTFKVVDSFYLNPFCSGHIHIDSHEPSGSIAKLNWSTNLNHKMIFYKLKDNNIECNAWEKEDDTNIPGKAVSFNISDVIPIYSHIIKKPTLLNGNIPHNVVNFKEPRHCFSIALRYKDKYNQNFLTYEDAINYFHDYIE